jgi:hypothetical protein
MTKKDTISMLGWIGITLILVAYGLLSFDLIPKGDLYDILNLIGALLVIVDAFDDRAYPPAVLNVIWFLVALISLMS